MKPFLALVTMAWLGAAAACGFMTTTPAQVVGDSFAGLRSACDFYARSGKHDPKADEACASVVAACAEGGAGPADAHPAAATSDSE